MKYLSLITLTVLMAFTLGASGLPGEAFTRAARWAAGEAQLGDTSMDALALAAHPRD